MRECIDKALKILSEKDWSLYVVFDIPETDFYVAYVYIETRKTNWSMSVNLGRRFANSISYICTTYIAVQLDKEKFLEKLKSAETKERILNALKFLYQKEVLS